MGLGSARLRLALGRLVVGRGHARVGGAGAGCPRRVLGCARWRLATGVAVRSRCSAVVRAPLSRVPGGRDHAGVRPRRGCRAGGRARTATRSLAGQRLRVSPGMTATKSSSGDIHTEILTPVSPKGRPQAPHSPAASMRPTTSGSAVPSATWAGDRPALQQVPWSFSLSVPTVSAEARVGKHSGEAYGSVVMHRSPLRQRVTRGPGSRAAGIASGVQVHRVSSKPLAHRQRPPPRVPRTSRGHVPPRQTRPTTRAPRRPESHDTPIHRS